MLKTENWRKIYTEESFSFKGLTCHPAVGGKKWGSILGVGNWGRE
jgi:hypothetical protein